MIPWDKRPQEIANLFNPAFLSLLLHDGSLAYYNETHYGLPFELAPLLLSMALHKETRELIPQKTTAKMHGWLLDHPEIKINFANRIRNMNPYIRESIAFGLSRGFIAIDDNGRIYSNNNVTAISKLKWNKESEPMKCLLKSEFIGKWFAKTGDVQTIYIIWGVRP